MWDGMRYHTLAWELKQRFGERLGKLSLDGGFTCPNRDGTLGARRLHILQCGRFRRFFRARQSLTG